MVDFIKSNDFCEIITDKFDTDHDIKLGARVFVAGLKALPISEEDPYTQRIKLLVHRVVDKHVAFHAGIYLMDPLSVRKVKKKEAKKLLEQLEADLDIDAAVRELNGE